MLGFSVSGRGLGGGGGRGGFGRTRLPISACLLLLKGVPRPRRPRLPNHLLWVWEAVLLVVSIVYKLMGTVAKKMIAYRRGRYWSIPYISCVTGHDN